jgi:hypothetical protein
LVVGLAIPSNANPIPNFVIDDFNFDAGQGASVADGTADGSGMTGGRGTGGQVLPGWSRGNLFANLASGDGVATEDCASCGQGHFVNDANSEGNAYWTWTGPDTSFGGGPGDTFLSLLYDADVANADISISFVDDGSVTAQLSWQDLAATSALTPISETIVGFITADTIVLEVFSIGGLFVPPGNYAGFVAANTDLGSAATSLDLDVTYLQVIGPAPEPSTALLLACGLAALGWITRRRLHESR